MNEFQPSETTKAKFKALIEQRKLELSLQSPTIFTGITATTEVQIVEPTITPELTKEYSYDTKYLSGEALDVFTTFTDRNQYLIKSGTGAGGTQSLLNQTHSNVIIVTANISQIIGKEDQKDKFKCKKSFYIYGGGKDRWLAVEFAMRTSGNTVVMTTPDSLMLVKERDPEQYEFFKSINLVVDEVHQISKDRFREVMVDLYNEMQTWKAPIKLSTATPQPYCLDIPKSLNCEVINVVSTIKKNQVVNYSEERNDYKRFIEEELLLGRDVVVFTNDATIYDGLEEKYGENGDDIVQTATGKVLGMSIARYKPDNDNVECLREAVRKGHKRLFILSSAYFAGYDFEKKASVVIISDQMNKSYTLDWLDIVQALGRLRHGYHNVLFVNCAPSKTGKQMLNGTWRPYDPAINETLLNQKLKEIIATDEQTIGREQCDLYNEFLTLNREARMQRFSEYGYHLQPYVITSEIPILKKTRYNKQIQNLMDLGTDRILKVLKGEGKHKLRNYMYEDGLKVDIGNVSHTLILKYYTAYILVKYRPSELLRLLENNSIKEREFCSEVRNYLLRYINPEFHNLELNIDYLPEEDIDRENEPRIDIITDYLLLYTGVGYDNDNFKPEVERQLTINKYMNETNHFVKWLNYPKREIMARDWVTRQLTRENITLTEEEKDYLNTNITRTYEYIKNIDSENRRNELECKKTGKVFRRREFTNYYTNEIIIVKIQRLCMFLYAEGKGTMAGVTRDCRVYSPLTALPKNLRCAIPVKYISYDIRSANPSIIARYILNIPNDRPVYTFLKNKLNITERQAKIEFNKYLNNHRNTYDTALQFFSKCYEKHHAEIIASKSAQVQKGSMFREMIKYEMEIIHDFIIEASFKYLHLDATCFLRLHDACVIPKWKLLDAELVVEFNGILLKKEEFK